MDPVWVGIHVRKTDYERHLNKISNGTLVTFEYFERAIKRLEESLSDSYGTLSPQSSDDPQWCKTQFGTMPNKTVIFANEAFKDNLGFDRKYLDMAIMSKMQPLHLRLWDIWILGAYLAGGHTILAHQHWHWQESRSGERQAS
ncbi:hypothetical protein TCAL_15539 [Tigriopus californicus]|uniref:L-Fucosyltransferase n=1 Tax=Tigriopus californicus TaxID=6832 RepID=A0A553PS43_TIGCA|nr:hypothetical protein TCAL_15539 [Tigriopus californicus]